MGYYVRAFCRSDQVPRVAEVAAALHRALPNATLCSVAGAERPSWAEVELRYDSGREPIIVEINENTGPDSLAAAECAEFTEEIRSGAITAAAERVLDHLASTTFVVCCQLLGDIDDDGYEANGTLLDYFVNNCMGVVQADGEGFYEAGEITVPLK